MYYLQSRYYDPEVCRFINGDDIAFLGATGTVLSFNLYSYCENNPVSMVDDTGELAITTIAILTGLAIGAIAGGIAGYKLAKYYKVPRGKRWKYVLGGIVIGGAAGALLGWGVGIGITALKVKLASVSIFGGKVATNSGMVISFARQFFEKTKATMSLRQLKHLITLCQRYGVDITASITDLTKGHGAWNFPHLHIGKARIHIKLATDAVEYLRKLLGI